MKIARKRIAAKEDRFAATQHNCSVDIRSHHHTVIVDATLRSETFSAELTLPEFAALLLKAARKEQA